MNKLRCRELSVFYFFVLFSTMASRIFLIFCHVDDNKVHRLSQMFLLKKYYSRIIRGLSVQKRCLFYLFCLFSKVALRIFLIFCMSVEDIRFLIPDHKRLSAVCLTLPHMGDFEQLHTLCPPIF